MAEEKKKAEPEEDVKRLAKVLQRRKRQVETTAKATS